MPNPFAKGWNYLKASLDKAVDDNADPAVLVHQAVSGAKEQHQAIADQAAAVIGNARQLEIQMGTTAKEIEEAQGQVRQVLGAADRARAEGDAARSVDLNSQAEQLASRLIRLEQELETTKALHEQALQAAEQAKHAVTQSEQRLRQILAQQDELVLKATQAKMQQRSVEATASIGGVGGGSSPTFEEIQAKIEQRYTTALGRQELAEATGAASSASVEAAALQRQSDGQARLDQIRSSMGLGASAASPSAPLAAPELTEGAGELPPASEDGSQAQRS